MELGRLIKTLRAGLGLSQETLAQKLHISTSYLCLLETGKREPSNDLLDRIADVFTVSREALIFLTTTVPNELKGEKAAKYKKLQENIASLLLFQSGRHYARS
jgi:transcriptional regulator with XRE-family HTH domain